MSVCWSQMVGCMTRVRWCANYAHISSLQHPAQRKKNFFVDLNFHHWTCEIQTHILLKTTTISRTIRLLLVMLRFWVCECVCVRVCACVCVCVHACVCMRAYLVHFAIGVLNASTNTGFCRAYEHENCAVYVSILTQTKRTHERHVCNVFFVLFLLVLTWRRVHKYKRQFICCLLTCFIQSQRRLPFWKTYWNQTNTIMSNPLRIKSTWWIWRSWCRSDGSDKWKKNKMSQKLTSCLKRVQDGF